MVDNPNAPKSHNCVVNEKAAKISFNLHFIEELMKNWWGNVDIVDTIGNFADKLNYDSENKINTFEDYIELLENEIIFQKSVIKLKSIIDPEITTKVAKESFKPKVVGKINLPPKAEDIF